MRRTERQKKKIIKTASSLTVGVESLKLAWHVAPPNLAMLLYRMEEAILRVNNNNRSERKKKPWKNDSPPFRPRDSVYTSV